MLKDFEKYLIEEKLADNTIASYINDVNIFLTFFKEHFGEEIIKLSHIEITEYIKELKKANTKATSINRKLAALSRYNMFLIKNNIQTESDVATYYDTVKNTLQEYINKENAQKALQAGEDVLKKGAKFIVGAEPIGGYYISYLSEETKERFIATFDTIDSMMEQYFPNYKGGFD